MFSQKKFDLFSGRKKQVDFFVIFKSRSASSMAKRNILHEFFLPDVSKLFTVVSDQAFSILPMIFPVVLLEDVIVED